MTDSQILKRYSVVTVITLVALVALSLTLSALFNYDMTGGAGIVSVIVPAMDAGSTFVRNTGTLPGKVRMWRIAFLGTLINLSVGTVIFLLFSVATGENLAAVLGQIDLETTVAILSLVCGVYLLAGRFCIGLGARQERKRQEKQGG